MDAPRHFLVDGEVAPPVGPAGGGARCRVGGPVPQKPRPLWAEGGRVDHTQLYVYEATSKYICTVCQYVRMQHARILMELEKGSVIFMWAFAMFVVRDCACKYVLFCLR